MAFWGLISGRFAGPPPSATSHTQHPLGGVILMPVRGCVCRLWSIGWGDLVSYPLNSLHMRNSVNTCVESYSGRCFTISSTFCINSFPLEKVTPYALRPSAHHRIIPRADNKFRRNFIIRMLYRPWFFSPCFRYHHKYCIIHACPSMAIYLYLVNSLFLCFFVLIVCVCQTLNKEFTYLLTYLFV